MGKSTKAKKPAEEAEVNEFTARHGDYARETIAITQGELGNERSGNVPVLRNRGGSTVQRWIASGSLERSQIDAMSHYSRAWHRVYREPRVVANLSPMAFIRSGSGEERIATTIDAQELLKFLDERIFQIAPQHYFEVWQNIVIFDEAAGVAGARLGYSNRDAEAKAKTICLFIADMIATILRL